MKKSLWVVVLSFVLLEFSGALGHAAAPSNKVVIAYASLNERGAGALLVARDQGFFRKQDLDVQLIFMRSAAVALSALSAGRGAVLLRIGERLGAGRDGERARPGFYRRPGE